MGPSPIPAQYSVFTLTAHQPPTQKVLHFQLPLGLCSTSSPDAWKQKWPRKKLLSLLCPASQQKARWHLLSLHLELMPPPTSPCTLSLGQERLPRTADSAGHWPPLQGVGRLGFRASISPSPWAWPSNKPATGAEKLVFSGVPGTRALWLCFLPSQDPRKGCQLSGCPFLSSPSHPAFWIGLQ